MSSKLSTARPLSRPRLTKAAREAGPAVAAYVLHGWKVPLSLRPDDSFIGRHMDRDRDISSNDKVVSAEQWRTIEFELVLQLAQWIGAEIVVGERAGMCADRWAAAKWVDRLLPRELTWGGAAHYLDSAVARTRCLLYAHANLVRGVAQQLAIDGTFAAPTWDQMELRCSVCPRNFIDEHWPPADLR